MIEKNEFDLPSSNAQGNEILQGARLENAFIAAEKVGGFASKRELDMPANVNLPSFIAILLM